MPYLLIASMGEWLESHSSNTVTSPAGVRSPADALEVWRGEKSLVLVLYRKNGQETTRLHNRNTIEEGVK